MEYRSFGNTYVVRLDRGEEILASLTELCKKEEILLGSVNGLGAADHAVVGLYDVEKQFYHKTEVNGAMEIASLHGNISTMNGETYLHLHIALADETTGIRGGHLNECRISATCEMFVEKLEGRIEREKSPEVGLNMYKFL